MTKERLRFAEAWIEYQAVLSAKNHARVKQEEYSTFFFLHQEKRREYDQAYSDLLGPSRSDAFSELTIAEVLAEYSKWNAAEENPTPVIDRSVVERWMSLCLPLA